MALDTRIPMMGQGIDTATPLARLSSGVAEKQRYDQEQALAAEDKQYNRARQETMDASALESIDLSNKETRLKIKSAIESGMDEREMRRLKSVAIAGAELAPYLDSGDTASAERILLARKKNIMSRMARGEDIDTEETDEALEMLKSDPETLKKNVNGLIKFGQIMGTLEVPKSAGVGGGTGELIDRLMAENPELTADQALQRIKAGYSQNTQMDTSGNIVPMAGAAETKGLLAEGEEAGKQRAELAGEPLTAAAVTAATNIADITSKQTFADTKAIPLLSQLEVLNNETFDTPYASIAQVPAQFLPEYQKQVVAFDLMKQNRTNLAIPLAKALGVNPTDKDFSATMDSIFDINSSKTSRAAQIQNLKQQISARSGISAPQQSADGVLSTPSGVKYRIIP